METLVNAVVQLYHDVAPRLHAAWTAFWSPGVTVLPNTSIGCIRVVAHHKVYGIYVPLDLPSWYSGSGADVGLTDPSGRSVWLDPPVLPGLRLRLCPRELGAVSAIRMDALDEDVAVFDTTDPLP